SAFGGSDGGNATVPSLATMTRVWGAWANCLMARLTMVRPATRIVAPGCSACVAVTTTYDGGGADAAAAAAAASDRSLAVLMSFRGSTKRSTQHTEGAR